MTVYELIQELAFYKPDTQVVASVIGEYVEATTCLNDAECKVNIDDVRSKHITTISDLTKNRVLLEIEL